MGWSSQSGKDKITHLSEGYTSLEWGRGLVQQHPGTQNHEDNTQRAIKSQCHMYAGPAGGALHMWTAEPRKLAPHPLWTEGVGKGHNRDLHRDCN